MQLFTFEFFKGLLFLLPEIAVLAACIYYLAKKKSIDGLLMCMGSFIGICVMIFYRIILPIIQYANGYNFMPGQTIIFNIISFISVGGSVVFAVGLFILIGKMVKQR